MKYWNIKHLTKRPYVFLLLLIILMCQCMTLGCRGYRTSKPPFHLNPNFDSQPKFKTQRLSLDLPSHTIPFGDDSNYKNYENKNYENKHIRNRADYLQADSVKYQGKRYGYWVKKIPYDVTKEFVLRGQDRFNIYCAVCHTKTGNGLKSSIAQYGWLPSNIRQQSTKNKTDGELFDIISNGIRTMPGYKQKLSVDDRWAIVAYVRALQKLTISNKRTIQTILTKDIGNIGKKIGAK